MRKGRVGKYQTRFKEAEPQATESGIGKNYDGFRMFHSRRTGKVDFINDDYSEREPTPGELERFRKDLQSAALRDRKVASYLSDFPDLGRKESKGEPQAEGIVKATSSS